MESERKVRKVWQGWRAAPMAVVVSLLAALPGGAQVKKPVIPAPPVPSTTAEPDPLGDRANVRVPAVQRRVLALYYPWYGTPDKTKEWQHYAGVDPMKKTMVSHVHYPASGPYDSTDPTVIDRHLQQAKAAGIDTLVCSWWGREDQTDKALRTLIARAPAQGMTVCVMWEQLMRARDPNAAVEDLAYIVDTFGKQPGYLKEGGKPVVFLFGHLCNSLFAEDWATVMARFARRTPPGVLAIGDGTTLTDLLLWDGLYGLGYTSLMTDATPQGAARLMSQSFRAPILLSKKSGRIAIEVVAPGYDDRKLPRTQRNGVVVERGKGELYSALWEQVAKDDPDWVLVNSFNQWHTGTEIEPSVECGDAYLRITADGAQRFKKGLKR